MLDKNNLLNTLDNKLKDKGVRNNTIRCYKNSFEKFIKGIKHKEDIPIKLMQIKNKSELSQVVNSIRVLQKNNIGNKLINENELKEIIKNKRPNKHKSFETYELKGALKSINALREDKYRLAYRLMLTSGLRVSEVAALKKEDFEISDKGINVIVQDGKGGKYGEVECLYDPYLMKKLKPYLESIKGDEKIFYTEGVMQKKAQKLNFKCHDLRRAYSKIVKNNVLKDLEEAPEDEKQKVLEHEVTKALRHARFETSKKYLYSERIKV